MGRSDRGAGDAEGALGEDAVGSVQASRMHNGAYSLVED
jgi:hypothetical protein